MSSKQIFVIIESTRFRQVLLYTFNINELVSSIRLASAFSEDSNQNAHQKSLISFSFTHEEMLDPCRLPTEHPSKTLIRLRTRSMYLLLDH